jgi:hypothetical protein
MNGFPIELQEKMLNLLKLHFESLMAFHGVHYLDIGYRYLRGRLLPHLAIRVHVHQKLPEALLESTQVLPKFIQQIPVDIIQSNPGWNLELANNPRNKRFDPLTGGIAIQNSRFNTIGTLGCITHDRSTGNAMGLSNYHVLVDNSGESGDSVTQPATQQTEDIIGQVTRWNETFDCAIFSLNNSRQISSNILGLGNKPSGTADPLIGMHVVKSGLTTGVTYGLIDGVSLEEFTVVPELSSTPSAEEISAPGDYGSIWLDRLTGKALGLHYAGETDPAPEA